MAKRTLLTLSLAFVSCVVMGASIYSNSNSLSAEQVSTATRQTEKSTNKQRLDEMLVSKNKVKKLTGFSLPLQSVEKRPIDIYRFGGNSHGPEKDIEEYIFIFGAFHGDEVTPQYITSQLLKELTTHPFIYDKKKIYLIPQVNPDGVVRSSRVNANKVDLNRNFKTKNFKPNQHRGTRYFGGKSALSEPESRIVDALIKPYLVEKHKIKIMSIHAPLAMNNYDGPGTHIASMMQKYNKLPPKADVGYPTPGSFGSYYGKELNIPVVTLETRNVTGAEAWKLNKEAILNGFIQTPIKKKLK